MDSSDEDISSEAAHQGNLLNRASQFLTQPFSDSPVFHSNRPVTLQESTESYGLGDAADIFALQEQDQDESEEPKRVEIDIEQASDSSKRTSTKTAARDSGWIVFYLSCLVLLCVITIWAYFLANAPFSLPTTAIDVDDAELEEAVSLLSVIPMITTLTLISISGSMATLFLLSRAVKRILYALLVCGPAFIVMTAFWTWGESWSASLRGVNNGQIGTEARWACLGALIIAALSARMIYNRMDKIDKTIQVIEVRCLQHQSL